MKKFLIRAVIAVIIGFIIFQYVKHEFVEPIKKEYNDQMDKLWKGLEMPN